MLTRLLDSLVDVLAYAKIQTPRIPLLGSVTLDTCVKLQVLPNANILEILMARIQSLVVRLPSPLLYPRQRLTLIYTEGPTLRPT